MKDLDWHIKSLLFISIPLIIFGIVFFIGRPLYDGIVGNKEIMQYDLFAYLQAVKRLFSNPVTLYESPNEIHGMLFIYPPPGIVIFIPISFIPYPLNIFVYKFLIIALFLLSIRLIYKTRENVFNKPSARIVGVLAVILAGIAPLAREVQIMNANVLFMFVTVLSFYYLEKKKNFLSLLALSYGIWLKLYPIVIFITYIGKKRNVKNGFLAVFSIGVFVLAFLPFLPPDLYRIYFTDYMVKFVNLPQASSLMNQSLMNFVHHFFLPKEAFLWWHNVEIPGNIRILNLLFSIFAFSGLALYYIRRGQKVRFFVFSSILALTPVISITGWEFLYVCAMPLLLFSLIISMGNKRFVKILVFVSALFFFITKPPSSLVAYFNDKTPFFFQCIFYFRMLIAVIGLTIFNIYLIEKNLWGKYGEFLRNEPNLPEISEKIKF